MKEKLLERHRLPNLFRFIVFSKKFIDKDKR